MPGEMPAILKKGEGVFTPEQMARMGPAGGSYTFAPTVNFGGDAGSPRDRDSLLRQMRALWQADMAAAQPGFTAAANARLRQPAAASMRPTRR